VARSAGFSESGGPRFLAAAQSDLSIRLLPFYFDMRVCLYVVEVQGEQQ
jgi:hypothetical protein